MNISSAIVYAAAQRHPDLRARLSLIGGVEVHAATDDGRMIITIESDSDRDAADIFQAIERLPGVLSMALIFQQTEPHPDQESSPCASPVVI